MNRDLPDEGAILALNEAHRTETSALDATMLQALLAQALHIGLRNRGSDAFLIALDQDALSGSPNFQWFKTRYRRFVYVDRIIVAPAKRGRGIARSLYEELFVAAAQASHSLIVCEVNVEPPNPASDAFHETLGFSEVGRAVIHGGEKQVRYLVKTI
jgi:uncharacterized protein